MISIQHPYPDGEGERYISHQKAENEKGKAVTFVLELKIEQNFCGLIEIREIDREHSQAELSFWLTTSRWGLGYMSEGIQAALQYGFEILKINRFYAYHMLRNPASGRVLEKNGFRQEGILRQRVIKWGKYEDVAIWAILRQDWDENSA
jgi:RimJ/RimL family protein N-acetyltransferase